MKDLQSCYVLVNSRAAGIVGSPAEELLGKSDADLYPPEVARVLMDVDCRVMESGEAATLEEELPVGGGGSSPAWLC